MSGTPPSRIETRELSPTTESLCGVGMGTEETKNLKLLGVDGRRLNPRPGHSSGISFLISTYPTKIVMSGDYPQNGSHLVV